MKIKKLLYISSKKKNINLIPFYRTNKLQNLDRSNQNTYLFQRNFIKKPKWIQKGDLLADCSASENGDMALGQNLLTAYMPWEGFNFEDAILINQKITSKYASLHIEKYEIEVLQNETITPDILKNNYELLDKNGIIKIGSWVEEDDILVGKIILPENQIVSKEKKPIIPYKRLLHAILKKKKDSEKEKIQDNSIRVPPDVSGRVIKILIYYQNFIIKSNKIGKSNKIKLRKFKENYNLRFLENIGKRWQKILIKFNTMRCIFNFSPIKNINHDKINLKQSKYRKKVSKIIIYIAQKHQLKVGDKMSGRHGNKGIISKICARYDMPYLPDGKCLDILLNPLGVPSRMNVGQIFECVLGLTGRFLLTKFQVICFDELSGFEASRSLIYSKLLESSFKIKQSWIFSKRKPGKIYIFDGRTGERFHYSILIGYSYIMKLIHIVDEKVHARSTGPYSLITQQPLRGRAKHGGQRIGEMEVWALQGFGCAFTLQELLTIKSDDLIGRNRVLYTLLKNTPLNFGTPESLRVVLRELQSLCLDLGILYKKN